MNKSKINITVICFFVTTLSYSQSTFEKAFGTIESEWINSTKNTTDKGFISAGQKGYWAVPSVYQGYLLKTSGTGNLTWAKEYIIGEHGGDFSDAVETSDGGFIVVGEQHDSVLGIKSNLLVVKTDSIGNVLWSKTYGGDDVERGLEIIQTPDEGYLILGETFQVGFIGLVDIYVIRTDLSGNILWTRTYGGNEFDKAKAIGLTSDGGFFIAGYTHSFGSADGDAYFLKADMMGNVLWSKTYGGVAFDGAFDGILTDDGGYLIAAQTYSYGSEAKINLIKTNAIGDTMWTKTYHEPDRNLLQFASVVQTFDLNYVVTGSWESGSGGYLFKVNNSGNCMWYNKYPSSVDKWFYSVTQTLDNGLIISTLDVANWGQGWNDAILLKTDSNGIYECNQITVIPDVGQSAPFATSVITQVDSLNIVNEITVLAVNNNDIQTNICTNIDLIDPTENNPKINVFPNPVYDFLLIENIGPHTIINLYDQLGRVVLHEEHDNDIQLNLNFLTPGTYNLIVKNHKQIKYFKVVIIR